MWSSSSNEADMVAGMQAYVRLDAHTQTVELAEADVPSPGEGEVLVATEAFGVGIHDRYFTPPEGPFPYIIGTEGSGVVSEVGAGVTNIEAGDRVMVSTSMHPKGGTWAEFAVIGQAGVTALPDDLDFATAAGIPVAGKSAVECIHTLDLAPDTTLFIAGASGAIGTLIVQMATRRGARVVASASEANHEYLRSMGAELAVDYRKADWGDEVRSWAPGGVDAAVAIQPETASSSMAVVRDGGHVVTVSGDQCPAERGIKVEQFLHRQDAGDDMAALIDDITTGQIRLVLEHVYPFEQALQALEKTETRHARGKLVVTVP